jgi:hypothetical protein
MLSSAMPSVYVRDVWVGAYGNGSRMGMVWDFWNGRFVRERRELMANGHFKIFQACNWRYLMIASAFRGLIALPASLNRWANSMITSSYQFNFPNVVVRGVYI